MRTFGQVPLALWQDSRFMALSDKAKLALLYIWCGPHSTSAGVYVLRDGYAAIDLAWNPDDWVAVRTEVEGSGLIKRDAATQTILIHNFFVANRPSNAKHLAAIRTQINAVASPELKEEAKQALQSISPQAAQSAASSELLDTRYMNGGEIKSARG